jgi:hypothetical protein
MSVELFSLFLTRANCQLGLWRNVSWLLVSFHAAAENAVDAIRLCENGRITDAQTDAKTYSQN